MPDNRSDDEGFLLRWSRRKRRVGGSSAEGAAVPEEASLAPPQAQVESATPPSDPAGEQRSDAATPSGEAGSDAARDANSEAGESGGETGADAIPAELADIDIDALDYESDYTKFFGEGVPEALKRRALRQLWRSNPILANVDGLNDYDDDFTDSALAVDVLKTAHRVGKGYFSDEELEDDPGDGDLDEGGDPEVGEVAEAGTENEPDQSDDSGGEARAEAGSNAGAEAHPEAENAAAHEDGPEAARRADGETGEGGDGDATSGSGRA